MREFASAVPRRVPAHHNDARAAWEGMVPGEEVPSDCEYVCALGAALLGLMQLQNPGRHPLEA